MSKLSRRGFFKALGGITGSAFLLSGLSDVANFGARNALAQTGLPICEDSIAADLARAEAAYQIREEAAHINLVSEDTPHFCNGDERLYQNGEGSFGKALPHKITKILVEFKSPPHMLFDLKDGDKFARNILSLCIQPDEGIHLQFEAKIPGSAQAFRSVDMDFHYRDAFDEPLSDAYERLILDAINGDPSLFTRSDEIEKAWALFDDLIAHSEAPDSPRPPTYQPGTWGPEEAVVFLANDSRLWRTSGCIHE